MRQTDIEVSTGHMKMGLTLRAGYFFDCLQHIMEKVIDHVLMGVILTFGASV